MTFLAMQTEEMSDITGALVWWELQGCVRQEDLAEALELQGLPASWAPGAPRMETVAQRAASSLVQHKRQMLRPLGGRGNYDFVTEEVREVVENGRASPKLAYYANVRVLVVGDGEEKSIAVEPSTAADMELARNIASAVQHFTGLLTATDVSTWLLWVLDRHVDAVSLRQRGGFYFVPVGEPLNTWRRVARCLTTCSSHICSSMSAVRSEDAVQAILRAVREEADVKLAALEEYLDGDVSTRGINAWGRDMATLQAKTTRYATLLGLELPEITNRATILLGALSAAKLVATTD